MGLFLESDRSIGGSALISERPTGSQLPYDICVTGFVWCPNDHVCLPSAGPILNICRLTIFFKTCCGCRESLAC
jgi:hypothetical protein